MKINYSLKGRFGYDGNKDSGAKTVKGFKKFFKKDDEAADEKPSVKSESNFKNDSLGFGGNWLLSGSVELSVDELKELDREYREQVKSGDILETAKQTAGGLKEILSGMCEAFVENADPVYDKIEDLVQRYADKDHEFDMQSIREEEEKNAARHDNRMNELRRDSEATRLRKQLDKEEKALDEE